MATQTVDQTQTVRLAPFQEEFLADIFASAKALTGEGIYMMPFATTTISRTFRRSKSCYFKCVGWSWSVSTFFTTRSGAVQSGIMGALGANYTPTSFRQFMDPFKRMLFNNNMTILQNKEEQHNLV